MKGRIKVEKDQKTIDCSNRNLKSNNLSEIALWITDYVEKNEKNEKEKKEKKEKLFLQVSNNLIRDLSPITDIFDCLSGLDISRNHIGDDGLLTILSEIGESFSAPQKKQQQQQKNFYLDVSSNLVCFNSTFLFSDFKEHRASCLLHLDKLEVFICNNNKIFHNNEEEEEEEKGTLFYYLCQGLQISEISFLSMCNVIEKGCSLPANFISALYPPFFSNEKEKEKEKGPVHLFLDGNDIGDNLSRLCRGFYKSQGQTLSLKNNNIGALGMACCAETLFAAPDSFVVELDLSENPNISREGFEHLGNAWRRFALFDNVEKKSKRENKQVQTKQSELCLQILRLNKIVGPYHKIVKAVMEKANPLETFFTYLPASLQVLELANNQLGNDDALLIRKALETHPSLTFLNVSNNWFTQRGLCDIFKILLKNRIIKKLELVTTIDEFAFTKFSNRWNFFGNNPYSKIKEACPVVALAEAIRCNRTLKTLVLSENDAFHKRIARDSDDHLKLAIDHNFTLLSVTDCHPNVMKKCEINRNIFVCAASTLYSFSQLFWKKDLLTPQKNNNKNDNKIGQKKICFTQTFAKRLYRVLREHARLVQIKQEKDELESSLFFTFSHTQKKKK